MRQLKIWIGRWLEYDPKYSYNHTKSAYIVAPTYKRASEISGLSYLELKKYFSSAPLGGLGSDAVIATCTEEGMWIQDEGNKSIYRRVK